MVKSIYSKMMVALGALLIFSQALAFAKPYKSDVVVSYYADAFHGKSTSSGEPFNMYDYTCAHKSLPFDTVLKVTNRANKKSVEVRVNDRGPFVLDREADLSKAAAQKIGMVGAGIARADIEIVKLGPDTSYSRATAEGAAKIVERRTGKKIPYADIYFYNSYKGDGSEFGSSDEIENNDEVKQTTPIDNHKEKVYPDGTFWDIQVGAYSTRDNANELAQDLLRKGFKDVVFQKTSKVYRVVVRNVAAKNVRDVEFKLSRCGYDKVTIRQRLKK